MPKYIPYTFNDPQYEVIGDLLSKEGGDPILRNYQGDNGATELMSYKPVDTLSFVGLATEGGGRLKTFKTNRETVIKGLDGLQDWSSVANDDLPIVLGTTILIPKAKIDSLSEAVKLALAPSEADNVVNSRKFSSYVNETQLELLANENYISVTKGGSKGSLIDFYPNITVYVWSRLLDRVINISPFIQQCDTESNFDASSFSITLPPILAEFKNGQWVIDEDSAKGVGSSGSLVAHSSLMKNSQFKENDFYFHRVISPNDLVFIQYETLEIEKDEREKSTKSFFLENSKLSGKIYDMIGVVDTNVLSTNPAGADINTVISGRDFTKFLIDDGSYFFIEELIGNLFPDTKENEKLRGRIFGVIPELNAIGFVSIETKLQLILNLFYTTGYYPNDLFNSFSPKNTKFDGTPRDGIWQIFDLNVDPSVANILLADNKMNESNGSIIATIKAIAEEPFVEVFTDTYKDRCKLIVRRQPFNEDYYNDLVSETVIDDGRSLGILEPEEVISTSLAFNDSDIYTWYYLIPNGIGMEDAQYVSYLQAVVLPEYVEIWGSRPYQKETKYVQFVTKKDLDAKVNTHLRQAMYDLQYMIEINAYAPFTRKGTITVNGDRTIKKGQAIKLRQTGEIYHVDAVSNSYSQSKSSVDRTTTLQVSRGMIEEYMRPRTVDGLTGVSYFNIVNTDFSEESLDVIGTESKEADYLKVTRSWKVNKDIFDFFYKKKQFC